MNASLHTRVFASLVALSFAAFTIAAPRSVEAAPPTSVCGIELPTLLALHDHARLLDWELEPSDFPQPSKDAASATQSSGSEQGGADSPAQSAEPIPALTHVDTVMIDPGHGGGNSGAIGVAEVKEKYLTLELAYALRRRLQRRHPDLRVVMTRYWDRQLSLSERTHLANEVGADLFLSLHYNAAVHNRAVGFETYFLNAEQATPGEQKKTGQPLASAASTVTGVERPEKVEAYGVHDDELAVIRRDLHRARQHRYSGRLAEIVQAQLRRRIDSTDRGVKQANFGVLRGALMPAVVVESGFLTHPKEGETVLGDAHRAKLVDGLVEAVEQFDRLKAEATPTE